MRINILTTKFDGYCGIGQYTLRLSNELLRFGYHINYVFIEPNRKNPFYYLKKAHDLSHHCDLAHIQLDYPFLGKIGSLTGVYIPIFYCYLKTISLLQKFKIITTMHEIWSSKNPPKFGNVGSLYIRIVNESIKYCSDGIIALSETGKRQMISENFNPEKIFSVIHGTTPPVFLEKTKIKDKLGINPGINVITIFGYIKQSKGHDVLIEAAKYLNDSYVILIAGDIQSKEDKDYFKRLIESADGKVRFLGFIPDEKIPEILNVTDIMVLPYREITQSGILNLVLSYGIPTITSDLTYFMDAQRECDCIVMFQQNNIQSLVSEIKTLSQNIELMKKLGDSAKQHAEKNTMRNAAQRHVEIYSKFLDLLQ